MPTSSWDTWLKQCTSLASVVTKCENIRFWTSELQGDQLSGKPGNSREFDSCQGNVGEKILSEKSRLKLFIVSCIFVSIQVFSTSTGMIWVILNMPSAAEECHEPSGNFTLSGEWSPCLSQRLSNFVVDRAHYSLWDFIGSFYMYRMAQKKVDHHAVCEHNLHKLLLNDALISRDDKN